MDPITTNLLRVIEPELGYRERTDQHTKFGEWYAQAVQDPQYKKAPWCDMFLAWAANRAGVQEYVGEFAWTPSHARWFEQRDAWTGTPEPGALVFFDWSGGKGAKAIKKIDHVGIVEKVANGKIHTIEANVDKVWLKRKVRDESKVVGYGLPRKVKEHLESVELKVAPGQAPGTTQSLTAATLPDRSDFSATLVPAVGLLSLLVGTTVVLAVVRPFHTTPGRHRRTRPRD
ncbi:CHAP domain-containing protein [Microtetraspora sp. NBRC 13810]|uniref:CHAP domain-containing protein n=1 Tax=Microtetraspora sp. NBRC 13810 TaxID=3030990 RepID=UPI00255389AD|nr:CHAP domain-containing protein [Microtetraspora sp. NBRC 13810]